MWCLVGFCFVVLVVGLVGWCFSACGLWVDWWFVCLLRSVVIVGRLGFAVATVGWLSVILLGVALREIGF